VDKGGGGINFSRFVCNIIVCFVFVRGEYYNVFKSNSSLEAKKVLVD